MSGLLAGIGGSLIRYLHEVIFSAARPVSDGTFTDLETAIWRTPPILALWYWFAVRACERDPHAEGCNGKFSGPDWLRLGIIVSYMCFKVSEDLLRLWIIQHPINILSRVFVEYILVPLRKVVPPHHTDLHLSLIHI